MSDPPREMGRSPNPDVLVLWEAKRFVGPFQHRLETWTAETVRLGAVRIEERNAAYQAEVSALRFLVTETREELEQLSAIQQAGVKRHSLVRDIKRAFERINQALLGLTHTGPGGH